jgi:hypothetical protein
MSFARVTSLVITPALLGATALLAGPPATPASGVAPGPQQIAGTRIPAPRPGFVMGPEAFTGPGSLFGVAALSAQYAWAVGSEQVGTALRTLIAHWNGRTWRRVASPNPPGNDTLNGVAATSAANAWAVGESGNRTLILHWNGRSWRQVPSPAGGNLASVAATSATNAWAVGLAGNHMLLEHWNGRSWRQVRSPVGTGGLFGVTATSAASAWAVGDTSTQTVVLHWNGKSWRRFSAPNPKDGAIYAVTATSASNAWAVGTISPPNSFLSSVLIEHWNGHSWRLDPASQPPQCGCVLLGVGASSARNAWAVGLDQDHIGFTDIVIEHWGGQRWRPVNSPVQAGLLDAVAAVSAGRAWAVGSPDTLGTSLIITWNGTAWH